MLVDVKMVNRSLNARCAFSEYECVGVVNPETEEILPGVSKQEQIGMLRHTHYLLKGKSNEWHIHYACVY